MPAPKRLSSALPFAVCVCAALAAACVCEVIEPGPEDDINSLLDVMASRRKRRKGNERRDRLGPLSVVNSWSDAFFYRQYRVTRAEFVAMRLSIAEHVRPRNVAMANMSSGGIVPLDTKILVTLRILAGAKYLDMVWYGISVNHVPTYVMEIVDAMNKCSYLDNIKLPSTPEEVQRVMGEWESISMRKNGVVQMPGTIGAVDGYQSVIRRPGRRDREIIRLVVSKSFLDRHLGKKLIFRQLLGLRGRKEVQGLALIPHSSASHLLGGLVGPGGQVLILVVGVHAALLALSGAPGLADVLGLIFLISTRACASEDANAEEEIEPAGHAIFGKLGGARAPTNN
jgi:hypothetical protein